MATNYPLLRGGKAIAIEREPDFFTTIIPDKKLLPDLERMPDVQQVKHVLDNVYKVRSVTGERDEVMNKMRRQLPKGAVVHHAYNPTGDPITRYYITDRIIVRFKSGTAAAEAEELFAKHNLDILKFYPSADKPTYLVLVTDGTGMNPLKCSVELQEDPRVEFAEPNLINRFEQAYLPTDNLFERQWHLRSWSGLDVVAGADVDAPNAWEISRGTRSVTVAVIDDGFELTHPDLSGPGKIPFQIDFVDSDNNPLPTQASGDYHGTPCAGVAIGEENGQGIVGIAPGCSFLPVRFPLAADDNLLWEIFEYAGQRADVLSCSWGPVPVYAPLNQFNYDQFTRLARSGSPTGKGCVILFAAGNYNAPIQDLNNNFFRWRDPSRGIVIQRGAILNGHAAHPDIITVAASTSLNKKAWYSNWGKEISICTPSNNFHPIDPTVQAPGRGIWTTDNEEFGFDFARGSRYTGDFGGTSSATPLAAGVAALIRSVNPELTALEVKETLETTADKITDNEADPVLGNQKGNYDSNGHSEWFGFGKVNAARALTMANTGQPTPSPEEPEEPEPPVEPEPPEEPTPVGDSPVLIVAGLVNPAGPESGNEKIVLFNRSDAEINLNGWIISDDRERTESLDGLAMASGSGIILTLKSTRLINTGTTLSLIDGNGNTRQEWSYDEEEGSKEGWWVMKV